MDCSLHDAKAVYRPLLQTLALANASSQTNVAEVQEDVEQDEPSISICQRVVASRSLRFLRGLGYMLMLMALFQIPLLYSRSTSSPSPSSNTSPTSSLLSSLTSSSNSSSTSSLRTSSPNSSSASSLRPPRRGPLPAVDLLSKHREDWAWDFSVSAQATFNMALQAPAISIPVGTHYVHVYQSKRQTCTIVHSASTGSPSAGTDCWHQDADTTEDLPECELWGVYRCYKNKTLAVFLDPQWKLIQSYLASEACRGGVHATGWSLGGTVASVLAACANNAPGDAFFAKFVLDGVEVQLPRIQSLVIFGANKITKKWQALNRLDPDGVFPGYQIWTERSSGCMPNDAVAVDMCQWTPSPEEGFHPRMARMRLRQCAPRMPSRWSWDSTIEPKVEVTFFPPSSTDVVTNYTRIGDCGSSLHFSYQSFLQSATQARWA